MGTSVLWCVRNIGAAKPENEGLYFQWGDTQGHEKDSDYEFSPDNYKFYDSVEKKYLKYGSDAGGKTSLDIEDDAAHVIIGGDVRMPTDKEVTELLAVCPWKYVDNYNKSGMNGILVSKFNCSVFFPMSGYKMSKDTSDYNLRGFFYTSDLGKDHEGVASHMCYAPYTCYLHDAGFDRHGGFPVRPVLPKKRSS